MTCLDKAGNSGTKSFALSYDATGPATSATADRSPDSSGWFNQPLTVSFSGTDAVSGTDSCSAPENYSGPDSVEAVVGGVCVDKAGNVGLASLSVSYDATAPVVTTAEPDRRPDANGWYNHPLVVGFRGSDATSGIAGCTQAAYAGPDSSGTTVTGSCQDHAGNAGGSLPFELRFDSTAPAIGGLRVKPGNGSAVLTWTASPDTTLVEINRGTKRVYSGTGTTFTDKGLSNGVRYRYTLKSYDEAGNSSTEDVSRDAERAARLPRRRRGGHGSAAARVESGSQGDLLPRPALAAGTDPERLAARNLVPAPPQLDLQRTPLSPRTRALPLVRLAGTWAARAAQVRRADRLELVPRALARSQNPRRQRQEDHVGEDEEEEREPSDHEQRVRRGRLLA